MVILGIDPGLKSMGYSLVDCKLEQRLLLDCGTVYTDARSFLDQRLLFLSEVLQDLIREFSPQVMAIETPLYVKNPQTALNLAQARGALLLTAAFKRVFVKEYHPWEIKKAVLGSGSGDKHQIAFMVEKLLNLNGSQRLSSSHESDAVAVALTCSFQNSSIESFR